MSWRYRVPVSLHTSLVEWCTDCILWISSLLSVLYSQKPCPWASPSHTTQRKSVLLSLHLVCSPWWHTTRIFAAVYSLQFVPINEEIQLFTNTHGLYILDVDPETHFQWQVAVCGESGNIVCILYSSYVFGEYLGLSNAWDQISRRRIRKEPGYYNRDLCPWKQGKAWWRQTSQTG